MEWAFVQITRSNITFQNIRDLMMKLWLEPLQTKETQAYNWTTLNRQTIYNQFNNFV